MFLNNYGVLGICMISICIITKNEADRIGNCLERLVPLGYEIVVTDTGSTDDTKNIAMKYTYKVFDFEWINDFSAARNFCASKASNKFIMALDSDEYLTRFDKKWVEDTLKKHPNYIGQIKINNMVGTTDVNDSIEINSLYIPRVYNKQIHHFEGYAHEQIKFRVATSFDSPIKDFPIEVDHVGYLQTVEQKKEKMQRNIALLEKQLVSGFEKEYTMFQIGKTYAYGQDFIRAYGFLKATLDYDLDPKEEWVLELMLTYMITLAELNQYDEALQIAGVYDAFSYSADFVFLMGNIYEQTKHFNEAIEEYKKATTYDSCRVDGRNSYLAYFQLGGVYYQMGDIENAKKYYKKALPYETARKNLEVLAKLDKFDKN